MSPIKDGRNNGDQSNTTFTLVVVGLLTLVAMLVFQWLKRLIYPGITIWESNLVTVFFGAVVAVVATYLGLSKYRALYQQLLIEINERWETERKLRKSYDELELRVLERTADIATANKELSSEIAERLQIENELRKEKDFTATIIQNSPTFFVAINAAGRTIMMNKLMLQDLGYTMEEVTGLDYLSVFVPEGDREALSDIFKRVLASNDSVTYENRVLAQDGREFLIEWHGNRVVKPDGQADFIFFVGIDITARRAAEQAARESEEQNRLIIESSPIGIRIAREGYFAYVNPALVKMLGYTRGEEIIGLPVEAMYVPEDREMFRQRQIDRQAGRFIPPSYEVGWVKKDGDRLDTVIWSTIIDHRGAPAVLSFVVDVSLEKALKTQLVQAQKMKAIGTLAGGIAHDFNNILGAIFGYTEMALDDAREGRVNPEDLEEVIKACDRARDLIRQILTFSRQADQERKPLRIGLIIKEALKLLRASLPATIDIQGEIGATEAVVEADPTQIHQVLMNLCTNSAQAMPTGGILKVNLDEVYLGQSEAALYPDLSPGSYLELTVSDSGEGVDSGILDRIFEPFFSTKKKEGGTGMGLAVVHGIVKSHGGMVKAKSEVGLGTTFAVLLPTVDKPAEVVADADSVTPIGSESILFVDDENELVKIGKQVLERLGYRVEAVCSSLDAMDLFRAHPDSFDLVITDQTMPHMTGAELIAEMIQIRPDLPIILCTGFSSLITPEKARAIGVREYILKPLKKQELAEAIRRALGPKPTYPEFDESIN
ncbi:MAG: PAS domain S-box protein [Deltaproteobacteria bacterium]|nr:PAS domain S-box protein [Deltaproteobacteria bacterium]